MRRMQKKKKTSRLQKHQVEYLDWKQRLQLFCKMSLNPARLYGINAGKIAENFPADLVVFDPEREWKMEKFRSKSQNSPFLNQNLKGKIELTICQGKIVYCDWE